MSDQQYQPGDIANGHRLTPQPDGSLAWIPVGPEHQWQPGDIANGHRFTQQPDGSMAWLPFDAPQYAPTDAMTTQMPANQTGAQPVAAPADAPTTPKKSRRGLWITLGAIGAVLLFIIIIGSINRPSADPVPASADNAQTEEEPAVEPEPEPEPEMVAIPAGLVGMTAVAAEAALAAVGLVAVYDGEPDAKVLSVSPAATEAEVGSTITLTVEQPPVLTIGQQNAVNEGESYLSFSAFSRSGLIDQLEYEGYSTADATFAVDFIAPDWNAEAAESAKSYIEFSSFSRQGLIDQLMYEGFTAEQANFGVTSVGY